jgi:hypothetical protein
VARIREAADRRMQEALVEARALAIAGSEEGAGGQGGREAGTSSKEKKKLRKKKHKKKQEPKQILGGEGEVKGETEEEECEECAVCLVDMGQEEAGEELEVLPCSHRFHVRCVDLWVQSCCAKRVAVSCPMCRAELSRDR